MVCVADVEQSGMLSNEGQAPIILITQGENNGNTQCYNNRKEYPYS